MEVAVEEDRGPRSPQSIQWSPQSLELSPHDGQESIEDGRHVKEDGGRRSSDGGDVGWGRSILLPVGEGCRRRLGADQLDSHPTALTEDGDRRRPDDDVTGVSLDWAADIISSVNVLFVSIFFLALLVNPSDPSTIFAHTVCAVGNDAAVSMSVFYVYSFCCFLSSSFLSISLRKVVVPMLRRGKDALIVKRWSVALVWATILACTVLTVVGTVFLTKAMMNFFEIRLGRCTCSDDAARVCRSLFFTMSAVMPAFIAVILVCLIFYYVDAARVHVS